MNHQTKHLHLFPHISLIMPPSEEPALHTRSEIIRSVVVIQLRYRRKGFAGYLVPDNFSCTAFLKTGNVSPATDSTVTVGRGVVTGRFTGMSSQVLSDRFVEEYKTRAFDRRKTGVAETVFLPFQCTSGHLKADRPSKRV